MRRRRAETIGPQAPSRAAFEWHFTHDLRLEAVTLAKISSAAVPQVDDRGGVVFVNKGGAIRLPVKAALDHNFLRKVRRLATRPLDTYSRLRSLSLCSVLQQQQSVETEIGQMKTRSPAQNGTMQLGMSVRKPDVRQCSHCWQSSTFAGVLTMTASHMQAAGHGSRSNRGCMKRGTACDEHRVPICRPRRRLPSRRGGRAMAAAGGGRGPAAL